MNKTTVFQCICTETTLQCGKLWKVAKSPQNHICVWNTTKVCTFTRKRCSDCLSCCSHTCTWHCMPKHTYCNITGVLAVLLAGIWSKSAAMFRGCYCTPQISSDPIGINLLVCFMLYLSPTLLAPQTGKYIPRSLTQP